MIKESELIERIANHLSVADETFFLDVCNKCLGTDYISEDVEWEDF